MLIKAEIGRMPTRSKNWHEWFRATPWRDHRENGISHQERFMFGFNLWTVICRVRVSRSIR